MDKVEENCAFSDGKMPWLESNIIHFPRYFGIDAKLPISITCIYHCYQSHFDSLLSLVQHTTYTRLFHLRLLSAKETLRRSSLFLPELTVNRHMEGTENVAEHIYYHRREQIISELFPYLRFLHSQRQKSRICSKISIFRHLLAYVLTYLRPLTELRWRIICSLGEDRTFARSASYWTRCTNEWNECDTERCQCQFVPLRKCSRVHLPLLLRGDDLRVLLIPGTPAFAAKWKNLEKSRICKLEKNRICCEISTFRHGIFCTPSWEVLTRRISSS